MKKMSRHHRVTHVQQIDMPFEDCVAARISGQPGSEHQSDSWTDNADIAESCESGII